MANGKIRAVRMEAFQRGESKFNTGEPCSKGHLSDRYTSTGQCIECLTWKLPGGKMRKLTAPNLYSPPRPMVIPFGTTKYQCDEAYKVLETWFPAALDAARGICPEAFAPGASHTTPTAYERTLIKLPTSQATTAEAETLDSTVNPR